MIGLYYIINLYLTSLFLLPALSVIFSHIPLSRKLIDKDLINDEKKLLEMQWKRFFIFMVSYIIFVGASIYFLGIGALISTAVNCFLCIMVEYKKILGKHPLSIESFLSANSMFFKDQERVATIVKGETQRVT